ncbi:MAG TPA: hypothetical protein VHX60_02000 [Acidobacteriaceae bacterium]|jgi:hypothetical protein|nr:hypothetical protein [Acidobacteriaceae bacterium]
MKQNVDLQLNLAAERAYRRGKWRCILSYGLPFGVVMFLGTAGVQLFRQTVPLPGSWLAGILLALLVFDLSLGLGFGWFQWLRIKRRALRAHKFL